MWYTLCTMCFCVGCVTCLGRKKGAQSRGRDEKSRQCRESNPGQEIQSLLCCRLHHTAATVQGVNLGTFIAKLHGDAERRTGQRVTPPVCGALQVGQAKERTEEENVSGFLGTTAFCRVNPGLRAPTDQELDSMHGPRTSASRRHLAVKAPVPLSTHYSMVCPSVLNSPHAPASQTGEKEQAVPGIEPGAGDSESPVLPTTPHRRLMVEGANFTHIITISKRQPLLYVLILHLAAPDKSSDSREALGRRYAAKSSALQQRPHQWHVTVPVSGSGS